MTVCHFELGRRIRTHRTKKNLSTASFANLIGLSSGSVNNIENANRDFFNLHYLNKISEVLEVPIHDLFYDDILSVQNCDNSIEIKANLRGLEDPSVPSSASEVVNKYLKALVLYQDHPDSVELITAHLVSHLNFITTLHLKKRELSS